MITWHLIQGCTFGMEIIDGSMIDPQDGNWFIVLDLFLVRAVINI